MLREASRLLAVPVVLLAATIAVLPSRPPEVVAQGRRPALTRPEVQRVYLWLTLVVLVGTGGTALVFRWLRGRGDQAPPLVDAIETHVEAEEILEPESFESARYAPARGRVVRAYLRFLARAVLRRLQILRIEPADDDRRVQVAAEEQHRDQVAFRRQAGEAHEADRDRDVGQHDAALAQLDRTRMVVGAALHRLDHAEIGGVALHRLLASDLAHDLNDLLHLQRSGKGAGE